MARGRRTAECGALNARGAHGMRCAPRGRCAPGWRRRAGGSERGSLQRSRWELDPSPCILLGWGGGARRWSVQDVPTLFRHYLTRAQDDLQDGSR
eukprot:5418907-Pyramimonas_sp.AAC.1